MMSSETLAITYGLSSAIAWGAGDFSGGFATKRGSALTVILYSQLLGVALLIALGFLFAEKTPGLRYLIWGGLAGIGGTFGLVALYTGLALGRMSIVAPMSAVLTAVVPTTFAFFSEGLPKNAQLFGFGTAVLAIWLISSPQSNSKLQKRELYLSALAGLGFGLFFICIDRVTDKAILWPLVAARMASIALLIAILFATKQPVKTPSKDQLPYIVLAGIFDTAGNAFFALASHLGRLDVSVILASLYPASTVMLAWFILKERLRRQQWAGVLAAIFALALIAAE